MAVATRTDEEVKKNVADELSWDDRVDATDVSVDVRDGRVVFSGTVLTYAARRAAAELPRARSARENEERNYGMGVWTLRARSKRSSKGRTR